MMRYVILGLFVIAFTAGCGGDSGPALHPVKGVLKIGGAAVEGVQVQFTPIGEGAIAAGNTTAGGAFEMYTGSDGKKGVQVGKYKVELRDLSNDSYMDDGAQMGGDGAPKKSSGKVPANYAENPLEVEVKAGENDIPLDVPAG